MARVPLVMYEPLLEKLCKLEACLPQLWSRVLRQGLSYLLCLGVVHVYAPSGMEFVFEGMPPHGLAAKGPRFAARCAARVYWYL